LVEADNVPPKKTDPTILYGLLASAQCHEADVTATMCSVIDVAGICIRDRVLIAQAGFVRITEH
jgi:hypothetical protein